MHSVYCLYTIDSNEVFYVGKAVNPEARAQQHRKNALDPNHTSRDLHRHLRRLAAQGVDWSIRVLETCDTDDKAREREMFYIQRLAEDGHVLVNRMRGQDRRRGEKSVWGFIPEETDKKFRAILD